MPKVTTHTKSERTIHQEYSLEEIKEALRLPPEAEVFMEIPGGGDYSNTNLYLGEGNPRRTLNVIIRTIAETNQ